MILFVRCGDRFAPPSDTEVVITLPAEFTAKHINASVEEVRNAVLAHPDSETRLRVAGPGGLCFALGMGLEHVAKVVLFEQLNQATKSYEIWADNRRNL